MSQLSVHRPLDEPDLHDHLRTNPVAVTGEALAVRERRLLDGKSIETSSQIEQELRVEAGADLAGEDEVVGVVVTDQQRAESHACALRISKSADDEFLRRFD